MTKATDGKGVSVSDPTKATFKTKSGKFLVPTEITNSFDTPTYIDLNSFTVEYYTQASGGSTVARLGKGSADYAYTYFKDVASAGTYYVDIIKDGQALESRIPLKIADDATDSSFVVYEKKDSDSNYANDLTSDTTITYTGNPWVADGGNYSTSKVGIADGNGNPLQIYAIDDVLTADGKECTDATNAGTYTIKFRYTTASGATENGVTTLTVEKLDLGRAALTLKDSASGYADSDALIAAIESQNGLASGTLSYASSEGPAGAIGFDKSTGLYTITVAGDKTQVDNGNVTGSGTVSFTLLKTDLSAGLEFWYRGSQVTGTSMSIDLVEGMPFDENKVKVVDASDNEYTGDQLEIVYTNSKGEKVDASALQQDGTYTMTVKVKAFEDFVNGWTGGSLATPITIIVKGKAIDADKTVAFYADGEPTTSANFTYDGTDLLDRISVTVKDGDKTYALGTDYTLEVKQGDKVVESIVDAGSYTVTVKPVTFQFKNPSDAVLNVKVGQVDLNRLIADAHGIVFKNDGSIDSAKSSFDVAYTGSALEVPGVLY